MRICPGLASSQSREPTFETVPKAAGERPSQRGRGGRVGVINNRVGQWFKSD
jgi:hypothetical protein